MKKHFLIFLALLSSLFSCFTFAMEEPSVWRFDVAPYLWAINMNGRNQVADKTIHISENFSDLFKQLNWGGMLWLDVYYKENLGLFLNGVYTSLSNSQSTDLISLDSTNNYGVFNAGLSYKLFKKNLNISSSNRIELEPYVGARYTVNNTNIKVVPTRISVSENHHWTDPIIGARFNYFFLTRWQFTLSLDAGGTNSSTDKSYDLWGILGYKPWKTTTIFLGYRDLYQVYETGSKLKKFEWDMRLFGPVLGIGFRF